jgi:hypothetical protein
MEVAENEMGVKKQVGEGQVGEKKGLGLDLPSLGGWLGLMGLIKLGTNDPRNQ